MAGEYSESAIAKIRVLDRRAWPEKIAVLRSVKDLKVRP